jgi:SAM-dependent methyltransferase
MPASHTHQANADQAALWNGASGQTWVEMQRVMDEILAPFEKILLEHALQDDTRRVLDVGCGAGATTLATARLLGQDGQCLGVDISAALIDAAKARAVKERIDRARFVQADAQTHAFEWNCFDAVISRFGVMFFDDPVSAFINIRSAARSNAMLAFVSWRSPAENPFMTAAARAAAPFLPSLQPPDPNGPGQFGFADKDRVRHILEASGWKSIDVRPVDVPVSVAKQDLMTYVTRLGPVGLALKEVDEETRERTTKAVRAAFSPFIQGDAARFNAACWVVKARA